MMIVKEELYSIGEKIVKNELILVTKLDELINLDHIQRLSSSKVLKAEFFSLRGELIRCFGEALYKDPDLIRKKMIDWSQKAAALAIQQGISLGNTLRIVSFYRTVIWEVFTDGLEQKQLAASTVVEATKIIDPMLDIVFSTMGKVYEKKNKELMNIADTAIEELSVPVVPIMDGLAVIPIVGEIDTARAHLIMEKALNEGSRLHLKNLILDVSCVNIIDTMVADQLFKIIKALKLIGIKTIITGMRPEMAQTIVGLGINFNEINTAATMQSALSQLGLAIIRNQR